jgi:ABC-2 type transport system ATP-binding protein
MIQARSLSKIFGSFPAVKNVNFEIGEGEIVGFIGPNGAGKTTTMRMLTGYLPPSEGQITVAGNCVFERPMEIRRSVGYLPETPPLYPELTVGSYLSFVSEIRELPAKSRRQRIGEVMDAVGLQGWENRILGSLSKGYRQRVGLAQAILHEPRILILDEPTSGLDPAQVVGVREFIRHLSQTRTVILSTHILSEVEMICDRIILINRGEIVADGGLDEIRQHAGGIRYRIGILTDRDVSKEIGDLPDVEQLRFIDHEEGLLRFELYSPVDPRDSLARFATEHNLPLREMERVEASLEEAFLSIVGAER